MRKRECERVMHVYTAAGGTTETERAKERAPESTHTSFPLHDFPRVARCARQRGGGGDSLVNGERCLLVPPNCLALCVPASQSAVEFGGSECAGFVYVRSTHCSVHGIVGDNVNVRVSYFGG